MIDLKSVVRQNILNIEPYSSARDEFNGKQGVFLDANENPFGTLNRYPDPYQTVLKEKLTTLKGVDLNTIFIGNGSDEVIDLAFRVFCNPKIDKALTFSPTYGMYKVSAAINNVELIEVSLDKNFQIDVEKTTPFLNDSTVKLIFICSPNNPTGNVMSLESIENILQNFKGIVLLDEAYIDFSSTKSLINLIAKYNNLIVCQTFSKAWGLAAARIGVAYSNNEIIKLYNKIKPPYNISELNQKSVIEAINNQINYKTNLAIIQKEKLRLVTELNQFNLVKKIYPSDANFLLVEVKNANNLYKLLVNQQIIIRNRSKLIPNCIRISIGTPEENNILINTLQKIDK